jgi:hypothetical protein
MTTRQKAIDIAKKVAKERDSWICQKCGKGKLAGQIQGAHIFPITFGNTAADPDNIIAMCASDHEWARNSWHNSPLENAEWFLVKWPGRYERLKAKAYPIRPIKEYEWKEKLEDLKKQYKDLVKSLNK